MTHVRADRIPPRKPAGLPKESTFGERLRRAREARGVTLEAIADATRITRRHLDALERGDLDALPAGPFAKSYIQAYAKVLGIDPEPILDTYREREKQRGPEMAEGERRMLEELSHLVEHRATGKKRAALQVRTGILALAAIGLGILGALGWFLARARVPEPSAAISPPPSRRESPAVGALGGLEPRESRTPGADVKPPVPRPAAAGAGVTAARDATARTPTVVTPTGALEVPDHGVGSGLVDRRLVGRSDRFPEGTTVSFWTLVVGGQRGHVIRHVWFKEGRAVMKADLRIGGGHWRTYSRLRLPEGSSGRWAVEARTSDGRLLARDEFLCESAER